MASASYTFTHPSNSVFTTVVNIQDASPGVVNWQAYFNRSSTSWTSYNINSAGNANAPRMDIALGGVTLGGGLVYYTYDFRTGGSANMSKLIGSGSISVPAGSTLSLTGYNDPKGSMGSVSASGSFYTMMNYPSWADQSINPIAIRGQAYSDGVSANYATSYSIISSSLPSGLSFNTSTGAITGTPTILQSRSPAFRASNSSGSVDTPGLSLTVNPPAPVFSDSSVTPGASVGSAYSDQVVASDVASYSIFSGALPAGLSLNTSTGVISGTPTTAESATFIIRATNVTGSTNTPSLTINVISAVRVWIGPDPDDFAPGIVNVWVGPDADDFATGIVKVFDGETFVSAK
jgi:hypothetical protein